MKTIHNINKWSFIITLVLYTTVIGGLLAQILLGFIQVVLALSILGFWKTLDSNTKKLVYIYWILVITYGITHLLFGQGLQEAWLVFYAIIPMGIAGYFVYVTYETKKSKNELELDYV